MPFVNGYTSASEKTMENIVWPNGCKCCCSIIVDYCVQCTSDGVSSSSINKALSMYGDCVNGKWMIDLLKNYNLKATFAIPVNMAKFFPDIIRLIAEEGHEIALTGNNKRNFDSMSEVDEEILLNQERKYLHDIAGYDPVGWYSLPATGDDFPGGKISPNTLRLLKNNCFEYFGNGMADDIPYYSFIDYEKKLSMLTLPYYYAFDSQFFMFFPGIGKGSGIANPRRLASNWSHELAGALAYGRQMSIFVQPQVAGWGSARTFLKEHFASIANDDRIWKATSRECAAYWKDAYPA